MIATEAPQAGNKSLPVLYLEEPARPSTTTEELLAQAEGANTLAKVSMRVSDLATQLDELAPDQAPAMLASLQEAARDGDMAAQYFLGRNLLDGGTALGKDQIRGLDLLTSAAWQGYAAAQVLVGFYYKYTAEQPQNAYPFLEAAARQGNARAHVLLSDLYAKGIPNVLAADALQRHRHLRSAAEGRDPSQYYKGLACGILADLYEQGTGVQADPLEAIAWSRKALAFGYNGNRVSLVRLLRAQDATAHAAEIDQLLKDAIAAGDEGAKDLVLDDQWGSALEMLRVGRRELMFWVKHAEFLGTEQKSSTSIRSTPGLNGNVGGVYSVTQNWSVLHFRDSKGFELKITPAAKVPAVRLRQGQMVDIVYAGIMDSDKTANGFPYRLVRGAGEGLSVLETDAAMYKELAIESAPKFLIAVAVVGFMMMFAGLGFFGTLIGLAVAVTCGLGFFRSMSRAGKERAAVDQRLLDIVRWVDAKKVA